MGNRLVSLPLPSFVGGTEEQEPPLLSDGEEEMPRGRASLPHDDHGEEASAAVRQDDREFGKPVAFASTFLLRGLESGRFLFGDESNACKHGEMHSSSLVTFHARDGDQLNYRGDPVPSLFKVRDGQIVTIYANIGTGRYLTPGPQSTRKLFWEVGPVGMAEDPEMFQFFVRRMGNFANIAAAESDELISTSPRNTKGGYLRRKLKMFPSFSKRRMSYDEKLLRTKTNSPPTVQNSSDGRSGIPSSPSESHGSPQMRRINSLRELTTVSCADGETRYNFEEEENQRVEDDTSPQTAEVTSKTLRIGDVITLESCSRPGCFLSAKPSQSFVELSSVEEGRFVILPPQLRHLINLIGTSKSSADALSQLDAPTRIPKEEAPWLKLLQRLPHELLYRVLQFKGGWVQTARLVCKSWARAAELHIFKVRINGEFACISTDQERNGFLSFVERCIHLTALTIRNTDELTNDELCERICKMNYLQKLAVGGCRNLDDCGLCNIGELRLLVHLNIAATQITDAGLLMITQQCARLETLNLYGCLKVTTHGVEKVLQMPTLQSINIRGTRISRANSEVLQRNYPMVQILIGEALSDGIYG